MRRYIGFIALLLLVAASVYFMGGRDTGTSSPSTPSSPTPTAQPSRPQAKPRVDAAPQPLGDGYILALSWSPAFCASEDPGGETDQCETGARSGLVVHGLWPERRAGSPEYCPTSEPERLPQEIAAQVRRFMPSVGLARHEWKKHGSCSGLGQRGYFDAMERAWQQFRQPPLLANLRSRETVGREDLAQALTSANPGLPVQSIDLQCRGKAVLAEIRLCLDKDLKAAACPPRNGGRCPASITLLPPR